MCYVTSSVRVPADKALTFPKLVRQRVFRTKPVEEMQQDAKNSQGVELKRTLGVWDLTALGVGFMCGAGACA